jgi:hypothetical protein
MFHERWNGARGKGIITEQDRWVDYLQDLDKAALQTNVDRQREFLFRADCLFVFEEPAGQRHLA